MTAAACLVHAVLVDLEGADLVGADFGAGNWRTGRMWISLDLEF